MKVKLLQVGADVESFVTDGYGRPKPCIGIYQGTKEKPMQLPTLGKGFAVQEDNVMVEYNIPPASKADDFAHSILLVKDFLHSHLRRNFECSLTVQASMEFTPRQLEHPQAQRFGCEPDFCVWTQSENKVNMEKAAKGLRTAGGHIHVSYEIDGVPAQEHPAHIDVLEKIVKFQDLFLGVPSVYMDKDDRRREMYGKAGAFRVKPYGHEYRVLSSFWSSGFNKAKWAFSQTQRAVDAVNGGMRMPPALEKCIQSAINKPSREIAKNLIRTQNLLLA